MPDNLKLMERISIALQRSDKSQRDLAKHMGLSASTVNRMLSKELDSVKYIQAVQDLTGYRFEWLRTGMGAEKVADDSSIDAQSVDFLKNILRTKDDLIKEQSGRIEDLQKYATLLESQSDDLKRHVKQLQDYISLFESLSKDSKEKTGRPGARSVSKGELQSKKKQNVSSKVKLKSRNGRKS